MRWLEAAKHRTLWRVTGSVFRVATRSSAVALTFDDGPSPRFTPRLLECLADHGVGASFFMVGECAARYPDVVDAVFRRGHDVANHSWSHASLPRIGLREARREIGRAEAAVRHNVHRLFRPPFGHQSGLSFLAAKSYGLEVVYWNNTARDWLDDDAETISRRVAAKLKPGGIVLLHDQLHDVLDVQHADRAATLGAVDRLLARFKTHYEFVPVSELLRRGRAVKQPWFERGRDEFLASLVRPVP